MRDDDVLDRARTPPGCVLESRDALRVSEHVKVDAVPLLDDRYLR